MRTAVAILLAAVVASSHASSGVASGERDKFDRFRYGSQIYDDYRKLTYWAIVRLSIGDYHYRSGDAEYLNLLSKEKTVSGQQRPREDIQEHFMREFKRLFSDLSYHDVESGREERFAKFFREHGNDRDFANKWSAYEEARRTALYGGRGGAIYCDVKVKRRDFPVLYELRCDISAEKNLKYTRWNESRDIGFGSPGRIGGAIKAALTRMLEIKSLEMAKIRKYGKE